MNIKKIFLLPLVLLGFVGIKAQSNTNTGTFKIVKNQDTVSSATWKGKSPIVSYPESARQNGIQGTVYVSFIVEANGTISNVQIVKGVAPVLDNEALRAVASMRNTIPNTQNGKPIRAQFTIPIRFSLE